MTPPPPGPPNPLGSARQVNFLKAFCLGIFAGLLLLAADASWAYTPPRVKSIIQTANRFLGVPYRRGGADPDYGFDCSGFVSFVLEQNGIDLGRSSPEQFKNGKKISRYELRPGDLVFFSSGRKRKRVTHVGIYLGNGEFIHAASGNHRIQINELSEEYWARHFYGARRI